MTDYFQKNVQLRGKYHRKFADIFGVPLADYFDNMTGFDIVKFDQEFIQPEDGYSTQDAVQDKYGDEAVQLVYDLLGRSRDE
jgi:hypothetical protein